MEDKKDIRKNYYYHPQYGVVIKGIDGSYYHEDGNAYVTEGYELESIYNHARRAWVEEAMLKRVTDQKKDERLLTSEQVHLMTVYYCTTYDLIQASITNFSNQ
jgi:hypothetical protein